MMPTTRVHTPVMATLPMDLSTIRTTTISNTKTGKTLTHRPLSRMEMDILALMAAIAQGARMVGTVTSHHHHRLMTFHHHLHRVIIFPHLRLDRPRPSGLLCRRTATVLRGTSKEQAIRIPSVVQLGLIDTAKPVERMSFLLEPQVHLPLNSLANSKTNHSRFLIAHVPTKTPILRQPHVISIRSEAEAVVNAVLGAVVEAEALSMCPVVVGRTTPREVVNGDMSLPHMNAEYYSRRKESPHRSNSKA